MKILQELRTAKGFETFTCLTYGTAIPWFESLIFHQLCRQGVRRFLIFADREQLSTALAEATQTSTFLGRGYLIHGVTSRVRFHSKLYLLTGRAGARLYVGSGNLGPGGLDRNREVFERWDVGSKRSEWPEPFAQARRVLDALVAEIGDDAELEQSHLNVAFSGFERPSPSSSRLLASPPALLEQLPKPDSECIHLRLVAPFFDTEGAAIQALALRLQARRVTVLTHLGMTNLTRRAVTRVRDIGGEVAQITGERPVHAKLLHARGDGWALGVVGSANISQAAWHGANHELVVVREGAAADEVGALIDALETDQIEEEELALLDLIERDRADLDESDDEGDVGGGPIVAFARWSTQKHVLFRLLAGSYATAIELHSKDICVRVNVEPGSDQLEAPSALKRGDICLARAWLDERSGPWAVIHDVEELRERSSPPSAEREALEALLGAEGFDFDAARALLEVFAEVLANRADRVVAQQQLGGEPDAADTSLGSKLVRLGDFTSPEVKLPGRGESSEGLSLPSARMMNRLLFGDEVLDGPGASADEGESELGEEILDGPSGGAVHRDRPAGLEEFDPQARQERREVFARACERARVNYVRQLSATRSRRPERLLEDLMILAAPLHYMAQSGELSATGLRRELVILLRAFLGDRTSPFVAAIERLDHNQRDELWAETPALLVVVLLVYNACLADLHCNSESRAQPVFPDARPILWLRHVIRHVGRERLERFVESSQDCASSLRAGRIFWLADAWDKRSHEMPFGKFVDRLIADVNALETIAKQILAGDYATRLRDGDDEDGLLVVDEHGIVGVGWAEFALRPVAFVRVGAFDEAKVFLPHNGKMLQLQDRDVVFLSRLWEAADRGEEIDLEGLDVLDRLADG